MGKKSRKKKERRVGFQHHWKPGTNPHDPDAGNPNVEYVNLGRLIEADEAAQPQPVLWTPGGGPESGMPCPNCGEMTRIVDALSANEILEPYGMRMEHEPDEKIVALGCPKCGRPVMAMRESALPKKI